MATGTWLELVKELLPMSLVEKATSVRGPGYLGRSRHTISVAEDKINSGPRTPSQIIVQEK